jgi:nicotinate phosphoribosyltransferase
LLECVMRDGRIVDQPEELVLSRQRTADQLSKLHAGIRRFLNPHEYPVGIDLRLQNLRDQMIRDARKSLQAASEED